jgi:hypothetical protein
MGPGPRDPNPQNQGIIYEYEIAVPMQKEPKRVYIIDHNRDPKHGGIGHIHIGIPKPGSNSVEPGCRYTGIGDPFPYFRK